MPDENCKMEVDGEAYSRKKLEMRKEEITKELRKIEDFRNMDEDFKKGQNDKLQKELTQIEQRSSDLLPLHEQMPKRSQKLQILEDKVAQSRTNQKKLTQ